MTQANRIVLNTLATYGRSLLGLSLGLFSTRWVLAALGKEDLGLYGLMGSCIVFVTLINGILAGTVARFYAYAIGKRQRQNAEDGAESMQRWFNAAFSIHAFLPLALMAAVYPSGVYALKHWLVIPPERMDACIWVFRMVLFAACVNVLSVPYVAMYRAKQLIAELSAWEILRTVLMFVFTYMLLDMDCDRLVAYGAFMTATPSAICVMQMIRARLAFDGCVIKTGFLFSWKHLKPMFAYAFGDLFGSLGSVVRDNGTAFLINLNFGPAMNASFGISNQVAAHTSALSSAMIGAIVPAVTTAEGSGDHEHAVRLAYRSIKFGVALVLVFCIPLIIEMDEVLRLWLVEPPECTGMLCRCMLAAFVCHKLGWGHQLAIMAKGRVVAAQLALGTTAALGVALSWIFFKLGLGAWSVGVSYIAVFSAMTLERAFFARKLCGMAICPWLREIVAPLVLVALAAGLAACVPSATMEASVYRVCLTSAVAGVCLAAGLWFFVFDAAEKCFIRASLGRISGRWR